MQTFQIETSEKLSRKICMTCNSLLARHSAMRKCFLDNQQKLNELLRTTEKFPQEVHVVKVESEPYTVTEPIEEVRIKIETNPISKISIKYPKSDKKTNKNNSSTRAAKPSIKPVETTLHSRCETENQMKENTKVTKVVKNHLSRTVKGFFNCDDCGYLTKKSTALSSHKWKVHNGPKPVKEFFCELCSKQFSLKESLIRHLDMHNKVIRYACGESLSLSSLIP